VTGDEGERASQALSAMVPDVSTLRGLLAGSGYLADDGLSTAMFCSLRLGQPILLEGEAGVGKTSAAKALAAALGTPLIRLQCYEGIDIAEAAYEWNYPRQLLAIRLAEAEGDALGADDLFRRDFLVERPLLRAVEHSGPLPAVLLIDEIDRADEHFEAFLLELLAERAITVPEIGTIVAAVPPIAVLTSNRTRDLHDALKRRCLYHWIDHPELERVVAIVRERVPGSTEALAIQASAATARLRTLDLQKSPGTAEVIDWVQALQVLGLPRLDAGAAATTLGSVLKYREDRDVAVTAGLAWVVGD
jgi:MoxR-like ATPase